MTGSLLSVNVGEPRDVEWLGRTVRTAIWKHPVEGRVEVRGDNLLGDAQADLRVHGGPDKAVYAYSAEDYAWWSERRGDTLGPGTFGENLTTTGMALGDAWIGEQWAVGTTVLEVCQPREPCFKLGIRMGTAAFVGEFARAGRPGAYLRIVAAGSVAPGDPIEVVGRPAVRLTIGELAGAGRNADRGLIERVATHPAVPERWRQSARRALARADRA